MIRTLFLAATLTLSLTSLSQAQGVDAARVDAAIKATFSRAPAEWQARIVLDETQRLCTDVRNAPDQKQFESILAREQKTVIYPADGKVLGDWKKGERIASVGTGGQFSDTPETFRGGNCYACHQMKLSEVSYGTLGPSLRHYGKDRKFDPAEARNTFGKIFNAQSVMPCSQMPRFGLHKFLTEEQIKDVTAYLFDPESPVNKE